MAKTQSISGNSGTAATPAPDSQQVSFETALKCATGPAEFCAVVSKNFNVRPTEVALLKLEKGLLNFIYPNELKTAGSIPISSSSAVAVHTVLTRKVELFNNFAKVKHVSVFETVKFNAPEEAGPVEVAPIQKLISAPITDADNKVLGILQVCRKASDLRDAGRDFTLDDLHQLEAAAKVASRLPFMQKGSPQH